MAHHSPPPSAWPTPLYPWIIVACIIGLWANPQDGRAQDITPGQPAAPVPPAAATSPEVLPPPDVASPAVPPAVVPPVVAPPAVVPEPVATVPSTPSPAATPLPTIPARTAPASTPLPTVPGLPQPAAVPSQLFADSVRYEGGVIILEGTVARPVRLENGPLHVRARSVRLDTIARTVRAEGNVVVMRERQIVQRPPRRTNRTRPPLDTAPLTSTITETLTGNNLEYDFKARTGHLDNAFLQVVGFSVATTSLTINGQRYIARRVILRPGGLTPAEIKIYGQPPFNIRAGTVTVDAPQNGTNARVAVSGAALYYKHTRLLPVPHFVYRLKQGGSEESAFQITPRVSVNSADRLLVSTRVSFPLSGTPTSGRATGAPTGLTLNADIGLSARVGFRGGLSLDASHQWGTLSLRAMHNDIVSTQLNNRIKLQRLPELYYSSPTLGLFKLPGGRRIGMAFNASIGRFTERLIDSDAPAVSATRESVGLTLTTRLNAVDGPYLDLFARESRYPTFDLSYRNTGYEIGYEGNVVSRIRGQFAYRHTTLSGSTPFRFDEVELAREARATFDIQVTPRWLIPIDLRYDLDRREFRDKLFGLLRSYKIFAYGVTYDTARREVKLSFRNGF